MRQKKAAMNRPVYITRFFVVPTLCIFIAAAFPLFAHNGKNHSPAAPPSDSGRHRDKLSAIAVAPVADAPEISGTMGFDEREGNFVPSGLPFVTEQGDTVRLGKAIKGPTILALLYYHCPNACSMLLSGIAKMLASFADNPESPPNVLSISIDEHETPADALKAKSIAFAVLGKQFPDEKWRFLTGPKESIKALTDAVGFRFVKKDDDFDHPLGIIILSPEGKVVRYITGTDFIPVEIKMSLMEASSGTVQPAIARVLRACFSYDPKSHQLVFNVLQVSAAVIFLILGLFIVYLVVSAKSRRKGVK